MPRTKRRPDGEGSVYKDPSGEGWRAKVPVVLANGRRRLIYRRAPTQREAEAKRRELVKAREAGTLPGLLPSRWTVESYLHHWLTEVMAGTVRATSVRTYGAAVEAVTREIGAVPLDALTTAHIERCLTAWRLRLAPASINLYRTVLKAALAHAVATGQLPSNPVTLTRPQRARRRERAWLDAEQALRLVETARAEADPLWPLWAIAVTTGLGRSELRGLQWRDIDRDRRLLYVERQFLAGAGVQDVKRESRRRVIPLIPLALDALEAQRLQQQPPAVWVFAGAGEQPLGVDTLTAGLTRALTRAGLPYLTPHMLRHSTASIWLAAGVPLKVVSTLLGHSNIGVTANTYMHVDQALIAAAGVALEQHFAAVAAGVAAAGSARLSS